MCLFERLKAIVQRYLPSEQITVLQHAYTVAYQAHKNQFRSSGEPYITHPLAAACILGEMQLDCETLVASLLHDTLEDTTITFATIEQHFGVRVAQLVESVSKLDRLKFHDKQEAQAENFRRMLMAMVQDLRVILIKLADRTHNMRTLSSLRPEKQHRIARETLEIYAPIAHRLGIHHLKTELEDLGFEAYFPNRYRVLKNVVKEARGNRKELIQNIIEEIKVRLQKVAIIGQVNGREKHLYSIYQKMKNKEHRFHSIMDIYAFRVIVEEVDSCYRVLGQIHSLYKPRPGRFKDYIAIPKANGYQSLHTSMIGPHGIPIELQIRTRDMDKIAEMGVAAHWAYKQMGKFGTMAQLRAQRWLKHLIDLQQSAGTSIEFVESVKNELFPSEIYVFTPKGRIVELPTQATPVDFAYAVHTDIGHTCVGARVDRQDYTLSHPLQNGQTVEIITAPGARPHASWLNFTVSSKARTKIYQMMKYLGKRLLTHVLGYGVEQIATEKLKRILQEMKVNSLDALCVEIGIGRVTSIAVAQRLYTSEGALPVKRVECYKLPIRGVEAVAIHFATCCYPIPGDPIVAYMSKGKGMMVHHAGCSHMRKCRWNMAEFIAVAWDIDAAIQHSFLSLVHIELVRYQNAFTHLIATISSSDLVIHNLTTEIGADSLYHIYLQIAVHNRIHLAAIIRKIKKIPNVIKVVRSGYERGSKR